MKKFSDFASSFTSQFMDDLMLGILIEKKVEAEKVKRDKLLIPMTAFFDLNFLMSFKFFFTSSQRYIKHFFYCSILLSEDSPWDRSQDGIKLGAKPAIYQKLANFNEKRVSMLTGLEISSLACKCVFYRPEDNA